MLLGADRNTLGAQPRNWGGITRATPDFSNQSAELANGMYFGAWPNSPRRPTTRNPGLWKDAPHINPGLWHGARRENNGLFGLGDMSPFSDWPTFNNALMPGLAGLGDVVDPYNPAAIVDPTTGTSTTDFGSIIDLLQKGMVALNSQQVFQLNLDRLQKGLAPIPTQYASPTMNLGLAGVSSTMILAGLALLAFALLKKR